ncbi:MAG: phosphatidylglycerophosphatase A, partial [Chlorobiales bacterium]|nr:phosphatidylglycerophosphatase A [Chlorobiales bacterium]
FFDITKIEPANKLQKLPKGWGVMMDDVMAGVYACLVAHLALWGLNALNVID